MKLTAAQIAQIEQTLVLNGLKYDDIKLEVTDHIASEIEAIINTDGFSFETAFKEVFEKWKPQLRPSSSFWVGVIHSAPKIVLDKWVSITKQQQLKSLLIAIIPGLILTIFINGYFDKFGIIVMEQVCRAVCLVTSFLIITAKLLIWKSKLNTSFGLIFKKNSIVCMGYLLFYGLGMFPLKFGVWDFGTSLFFNIMISFLFIYSIFNLQLVYKHLQFEKKLSISNT